MTAAGRAAQYAAVRGMPKDRGRGIRLGGLGVRVQNGRVFVMSRDKGPVSGACAGAVRPGGRYGHTTAFVQFADGSKQERVIRWGFEPGIIQEVRWFNILVDQAAADPTPSVPAAGRVRSTALLQLAADSQQRAAAKPVTEPPVKPAAAPPRRPFREPSARELRRERRAHEAAWRWMTPAARDARTAELEDELARMDGPGPDAAEPPPLASPLSAAATAAHSAPAPAPPALPAGYHWGADGFPARDERSEQEEYAAILAQVIANVPPGYFWDADGNLQSDPPERGALAVAECRCPVCGHAPGSPCHTMTAAPQPRKRPHPKRSALIAWPPR